MRLVIVKNWWSLVLRGALGVVLGFIAFAWPGITLRGLVILFGAYALIVGAVSLAGALHAAQAQERWISLVIEGLICIAAAVVAITWPTITIFSLVYLIGAWALISGLFEIAAAFRLRKHISGEWLLALSGIVSVIFGVLVMMMPIAGALVMAFWFGAYALIFGVILIALGFRLRGVSRRFPAGPPMPLPAR